MTQSKDTNLLVKGKWYKNTSSLKALYRFPDVDSELIGQVEMDELVMYLHHNEKIHGDRITAKGRRYGVVLSFVQVGFRDMFGWLIFVSSDPSNRIDSNGAILRERLERVTEVEDETTG